MNTWDSIKLIVLAASTIHGFNAGHRLGQRASRTVGTKYRPSPLFYTDIEPEIQSITIPPPVLHFNETFVVVETCESGSGGVDDDATEGGMEISRRLQPPTLRDTKSKKRKNEPSEKEEGTKIGSTVSKVSTEALKRSSANDEILKTKKPKAYKPHRAVWQTRYNELIEYKAANGHCQVPQSYSAHRKLGLWVMQQRRQRTLQLTGKRSSFNGSEGEKRIQLLDEIGFTWRVDRRGPRGAYGSLRMMKEHADTAMTGGGSGNEILDAVDFEKYMIEKSAAYSDEEIRDAWSQRFELFK